MFYVGMYTYLFVHSFVKVTLIFLIEMSSVVDK